MACGFFAVAYPFLDVTHPLLDVLGTAHSKDCHSFPYSRAHTIEKWQMVCSQINSDQLRIIVTALEP